QTSLDVWMADFIANMQPGMPMAPPALKHALHLDASNGYGLDMTRGYVNFEHAQYGGAKFNGADGAERTYHWHALGFDGPALPADRIAQAPDSLTPAGDGSVNVGYRVQGSKTFALPGLPIDTATSAYVTFDWREDSTADPGLAVRVNGGAAVPVVFPPGGGSFGTTNALAAVPLSELRPDANTVEVDAPNGITIANLDLGTQGGAAPDPTATATMEPT